MDPSITSPTEGNAASAVPTEALRRDASWTLSTTQPTTELTMAPSSSAFDLDAALRQEVKAVSLREYIETTTTLHRLDLLEVATAASALEALLGSDGGGKKRERNADDAADARLAAQRRPSPSSTATTTTAAAAAAAAAGVPPPPPPATTTSGATGARPSWDVEAIHAAKRSLGLRLDESMVAKLNEHVQRSLCAPPRWESTTHTYFVGPAGLRHFASVQLGDGRRFHSSGTGNADGEPRYDVATEGSARKKDAREMAAFHALRALYGGSAGVGAEGDDYEM